MNIAGLFGRMLRGAHQPGPQERARIAAAVADVAALSPHLRMARHYEARLEQATAVALRHVQTLVAALAPAREASAAAWSSDPCIHAFFRNPDAVAPALSHSSELRAFFERNPDSTEAYGVLGMAMVRKRTLGAALEGEMLRRDVIQETISFSDYQVRICGKTETGLRDEIVRRMVQQLGLLGLARFAADESRRGRLEQERELLKTRLRLLGRTGAGMGVLLGVEAQAGALELVRLQEELDANESELERLGLRSEAIERELAEVCAVLADPAPHLSVETRGFVLNKMNVVLPEASRADGEEVTFELARVPTIPPSTRAFTLVRFARADLCGPADLLGEAARLLGER